MAKKRANGKGSIRKRKDGRWEGRYTAGHYPETGKDIYKNVLGRTQTEVKEKLKAAIRETQSLDFTKAGKYTVEEWMEVWFEVYAKIKVRPSSHQTYRGYIDNHIKHRGHPVRTASVFPAGGQGEWCVRTLLPGTGHWAEKERTAGTQMGGH